jgi:protein-tyrosine phosphatase
MGAAPTSDAALSRFDALVLCAAEWQPYLPHAPVTEVIYAGFRDTLTPEPFELARAEDAGRYVEEFARRERAVLVTCIAGRNRSGLVTGIALQRLGVPAAQAIGLVQRNRPDALSNPVFVQYLESRC